MKKVNPNVKGILASGYLSAEVKSHVAEGFLSGVIQKPYHIDEVLEKIEGAIRSQINAKAPYRRAGPLSNIQRRIKFSSCRTPFG